MTERPILELIDGTKLDHTAYELLRRAVGAISAENDEFRGHVDQIEHLGQGKLYVTVGTYHGPYRLTVEALPDWNAAQSPPEPHTASAAAEMPVEKPRPKRGKPRPYWMDRRDQLQAELDAEIREPVSAVERCPEGHDIEQCTCTPSWERDGDAV